MQMHIRHETRYRYERTVKYSVQSLHLTPRRDQSQRSIAWNIASPGRRLEQIDAYGNISHLLTIEEPHREIRILVHGVVETADNEARQDDGPLSPLAYLAPTQLTLPNDDLRAFAQSALSTVIDPRQRAQVLAEAVCDAVRYKSGTSEVQDTAASAFKNGEGVCQDHAHVFIAAARALGMPARYVSGYLYTGDASDAASHAWADVWLGAEIGWQSMDVTHKRPAVRTYCRLAVGRDYLDAAPVRGMRQGGGGEKMEANVLVAESAQQQ
ncbi:MAG: transglutaminase-like superfamily protein [Gammaproteobacteria bacterium]|nr:transglutaminase-like superfamily protein [Gammaproteobacteria bacterium]